ncbi:MAG TPA: sialidase family protein [Chthonomonadaceae bacterium]|nr:sialidase family protein [Chthonomonadaceae bacterium]
MLARILIVSLLCLLMAARVRAENASPPQTVATFDQMPKTVTLPDGTLMAFFHPITGEMREATARTSQDNGKTWSDLKTLFTLPDEAGGFGYTLPFIDRAGELHLFLLCDANSGQVRPARGQAPKGLGPLGKLDIWEARTTGQRRSWLPPRRIWEGRAGDMQSVIQLKSGRILLPLSYYVPRDWSNRGTNFDAFTWMGSFRVSALYSDDGGATWKQSPAALETPTTAIGELGAIEPVAIELKDGRVWMLIRTQIGRFYETFSPDGITWTPPQPTNIPSSDSPAGLVRLKDGRILLFVNDCRRFPYANGGRQVLHLALSSDEGRTWRGFREILRDPYRNEPPPPNGDHGVSYPYPTLLSDGRVLFSLWVATGKTRALTAFDPNWVLETEQQTDFSQGMEDWSAFGVRGVGLVAHPDKPGRKALAIRKPEADWPAGAVWNFPAGVSGTLKLRLQLQPGFAGALIGLTDHFSAPFDDQDEIYNLFNLKIGSEGRIGQENALKPGVWHDLELAWDTKAGQCRVTVDGRAVARLRQTRLGPYVNYLRLRSTAEATDSAGFLVASVEAQSRPEETARRPRRASSTQAANLMQEGQ